VPDFLQNDDDTTDPTDPTDPADPTDPESQRPEIITGLSGHPFGCSLQTGAATGTAVGVDPVLPSILAVLAAMGFMRRRKAGTNE